MNERAWVNPCNSTSTYPECSTLRSRISRRPSNFQFALQLLPFRSPPPLHYSPPRRSIQRPFPGTTPHACNVHFRFTSHVFRRMFIRARIRPYPNETALQVACSRKSDAAAAGKRGIVIIYQPAIRRRDTNGFVHVELYSSARGGSFRMQQEDPETGFT